jgi:hypothetical protein
VESQILQASDELILVEIVSERQTEMVKSGRTEGGRDRSRVG